MLYILLILILLILLLTYNFLTKNFDHWKKKGVPFIKPLPLLGNCVNLALLRQSVPDWIIKCCLRHKKEPFFGIWMFMEPSLVVLSPELLKNIFIKDFNVFPNRAVHYAPEIDPIITEGLMFVPSPDWKTMRQKLSPSFNLTKAKRTLMLMDDCASKLKTYILSELTKESSRKNKESHLKNKESPLDMYDISKTYVIQTMTSIFFGLEAECFKSKDCPFKSLGKRMYAFTFANSVRSFGYFFCPALVDYFKLFFLGRDISEELKGLIQYSIEERERSGGQRGDFIDSLIELKKEAFETGDDTFNDNRILAQPAAYFSAGFVTSSSVLAFALHELCLDLDLQNKLRKEILYNLKKFGGCNYEAIQNMPLLDAVFLETMRKYPALPFLDRRSVEEYKIPGSDVVLEKDTRIIIPTMYIHYNPEYYPDPEKFDPYRFMGKNKKIIDEANFLAFGSGPRFCIGKQYGQLIGKMGLIHILSEFEVEKSPETNDPVVFEIKSFFVESSNRSPMYIRKLKK